MKYLPILFLFIISCSTDETQIIPDIPCLTGQEYDGENCIDISRQFWGFYKGRLECDNRSDSATFVIGSVLSDPYQVKTQLEAIGNFQSDYQWNFIGYVQSQNIFNVNSDKGTVTLFKDTIAISPLPLRNYSNCTFVGIKE